MKIRKNSEQIGFDVDVDFYRWNKETWGQFEQLVNNEIIQKALFGGCDKEFYFVDESKCKEIKVKYFSIIGKYKSVVVTKNDIEIVVTL